MYYTYAYLREDGSPYYIGKGCNNRINAGHKHIPLPPKERRIYLKQNLTETEALTHEKYLVSVLGRKNNNTGILLNFTDGGDNGGGGWNKGMKMSFSPERADKISAANKGRPVSPEHRKKLSAKGGHNRKTRTYYHPDGHIIIITHLMKYCETHKLSYQHMKAVYNDKKPQYRGYRKYC